jgi:hypothetical protein
MRKLTGLTCVRVAPKKQETSNSASCSGKSESSNSLFHIKLLKLKVMRLPMK